MEYSNVNKNAKKKTKKLAKEEQYERSFPRYFPNREFITCFINSTTTESQLNEIRLITQNEQHYVIDTESTTSPNTPALIQILIVRETPAPDVMLLIEFQHLPPQSTTNSKLIKSIFDEILAEKKFIYSWGEISTELLPFRSILLFHWPILATTFDVQGIFKRWFNDFVQSEQPEQEEEDANILILNAPLIDPTIMFSAKEINEMKMTKTEKWSIQDAIAYTINQYLSKRETLWKWDIGLDQRLPTRNKHKPQNYRNRLIQYATHDCTALCDIMMIIYNNHALNSTSSTKKLSLDECMSLLKDKHKLLFKKKRISNIFLDTDSDDSMSAYDFDEHLQSTIPNPLNNDPIPMPEEPIQTPEEPVRLDLESKNFDQIAHADEPVKLISKKKRKRSLAARKRRNQKAGIRHKRQRYDHPIRRELAMPVREAKRLIRSYPISVRNMNPIGTTLMIGMKSQEQMEQCEQLFPVNMFL